MAFYVEEGDGVDEGGEKSQNLKFNVGLGLKMLPRIRVVEGVARSKSFD
jgi:hypothetical protein